jgi:hypothetical protein
MALAHMLANRRIRADVGGRGWDGPGARVRQVVLFAQSLSHATRFERGEIERLGLTRFALEDVRDDPEGAAR